MVDFTFKERFNINDYINSALRKYQLENEIRQMGRDSIVKGIDTIADTTERARANRDAIAQSMAQASILAKDPEYLKMSGDRPVTSISRMIPPTTGFEGPANQVQMPVNLSDTKSGKDSIVDTLASAIRGTSGQAFLGAIKPKEETDLDKMLKLAKAEKMSSDTTTPIYRTDPASLRTIEIIPGSGSRQTVVNALTEGITKGQTKLDQDFAKEYSDFVAKGGAAEGTKQLSQIDDAINKLKTTKNTSGVVGFIPKGVRDITPGLSKGAAIKDQVEEVVQRNLRLVLGPQFTQVEGERLISRAYNDKQRPEENAIRLERLKKQMVDALQAKAEASRYFEQNGTLKGFKGKLYTKASDFNIEGNTGGGASGFDPDSY